MLAGQERETKWRRAGVGLRARGTGAGRKQVAVEAWLLVVVGTRSELGATRCGAGPGAVLEGVSGRPAAGAAELRAGFSRSVGRLFPARTFSRNSARAVRRVWRKFRGKIVDSGRNKRNWG
jgi:hypothetical protein